MVSKLLAEIDTVLRLLASAHPPPILDVADILQRTREQVAALTSEKAALKQRVAERETRARDWSTRALEAEDTMAAERAALTSEVERLGAEKYETGQRLLVAMANAERLDTKVTAFKEELKDMHEQRRQLTSEVERLKSALLIRDAEVSVLLQRDADLAQRISALTKAPATEVHGGSPCCNPDCRGTWGANCPHCHRLDHECTPENGERDRALAGWRCFHCGAFFEKRALAENHFGYTGSAPPLCFGSDPDRALLGAAPPESEPAPSEPEALREARKLLERAKGEYERSSDAEARLDWWGEVRDWLARHPGPQPEDGDPQEGSGSDRSGSE